MWFGCHSGCAEHDGSVLSGQPIGPPLFFPFKPGVEVSLPPPHRRLEITKLSFMGELPLSSLTFLSSDPSSEPD
jgi:hypothetical protein